MVDSQSPSVQQSVSIETLPTTPSMTRNFLPFYRYRCSRSTCLLLLLHRPLVWLYFLTRGWPQSMRSPPRRESFIGYKPGSQLPHPPQGERECAHLRRVWYRRRPSVLRANGGRKRSPDEEGHNTVTFRVHFAKRMHRRNRKSIKRVGESDVVLGPSESQ